MMKLPQATWIETFVEDVTDKITGLPILKELAWFVNTVHQKILEKLVRTHTNLVLGRVWMTTFIIYYRGT